MLREKTVGMAVVLAASVMWAIEPTLAKLSYQTASHLDTFATRAILSLLTISAYLLIVRREGLRVERKYLPKLIYISLAATLFADLMYIYALTKVAVINAVLIGHMQPIFIVLFGFLFLKEDRITKSDYLGILSMVAAGLLVTSKTLSNLFQMKIGSFGDLYVLLATIAWATTAIVVRKYLRVLNPGIISFYRFLFATIVFVTYMVSTQGIHVTNIYQIILGIVIGTGTILYYEGLRLIKAAQVSALELSTPFFATIFGIAVLREYITPVQFCGFLFLISGMFFLSRRERT